VDILDWIELGMKRLERVRVAPIEDKKRETTLR